MRAAILHSGGIDIGEVPDPTPAEGQILVAPLYTGICGSDLHLRSMLSEAAKQAPPESIPRIVPGHEFSAEVVGLGPNTESSLKPGDRIVAIPFANTCGGMQTIGLSAAMPGGLASLSAVVADRCFRIPDGVPDDLAALTEPLSVGRHAARLANRQAGPNLIIGCGPVGLAVLLALRAEGRGPIIASDFSPERRRIAEALGADVVVDPAQTSPYTRWDEIGFSAAPTSPLLPREFEGAPHGLNIFECVGAPSLLDEIIKNAPQHSHIVVVGVCSHVVKHTPFEAIVRELTVEYSFAYRPREFEASLRLVAEQPDTVAKLITSRRPLSETALAFDQLASSPSEIKVLINPRT